MSLSSSNAFIVACGGSNSALCVLPVYLNDGVGNLTAYGIRHTAYQYTFGFDLVVK